MSNTTPNSSSPSPRRGARAGRSRAVRTAVAGGLAAGSAFAAIAGISLATTTTSRSHTTSASRSSASAPALRGPRGGGPGPLGGHGGPGGPTGHGPGGPDSGTITEINGSTLTLRTENGTETVETSSSTSYSKEMQTISFSDLRTGDIIAVAPTAPSSSSSSFSSSSSTPPQPGTGSVKAAAVTIVEPSLTGRVISNSNGTYSLVGPGGQLLTVTTNGSTRYYNRSMSRTSSSAIASGDHVMAEGTQTDLTHLTTDVIAVMPNPPAPPAGAPTVPRARGVSGARRFSRSLSRARA